MENNDELWDYIEDHLHDEHRERVEMKLSQDPACFKEYLMIRQTADLLKEIKYPELSADFTMETLGLCMKQGAKTASEPIDRGVLCIAGVLAVIFLTVVITGLKHSGANHFNPGILNVNALEPYIFLSLICIFSVFICVKLDSVFKKYY